MRTVNESAILCGTVVARGRGIPELNWDDECGPYPRTPEEKKELYEAYRREIAMRHVRDFYRKKRIGKIPIIYGTAGGHPVYEKPTEKRDALIMYAGLWLPLLMIEIIAGDHIGGAIPFAIAMALSFGIPFYFVKKL